MRSVRRPLAPARASAACLLLVAAALSSVPLAAEAAFATPDNWSRSTPDTTWHQWDLFTSVSGTPANLPDVGAYPGSGAGYQTFPGSPSPNVFDSTGNAVIFSPIGGNLYGLNGPSRINVVVPAYDRGDGFVTTVFVQTRVVGSEADYQSLKLTYDGAAAPLVPVLAGEQERISTDRGDTVEYAAVFHVPTSPGSFTFTLDATAAHMSFDAVAVDTIVTPVASGYVAQAVVPEPTGLSLAGLATVGLLARRRRVVRRTRSFRS